MKPLNQLADELKRELLISKKSQEEIVSPKKGFEQKPEFYCNICGKRLWVSTDGKTIYCDHIKANTQPRTEKEFMEDHVYGEMMTMDIPYSDEFLKENE